MSIARRIPLVLLAVLPVVLIAGVGNAQTFTGTLTGTAEVPPNASPGTGSTFVTYDAGPRLLTVDAAFSNLVSPAVAAHIHCCVGPSANAPVATPLSGFPSAISGSYVSTFDLTLASSYSAGFVAANGGTAAGAEAALATGMANGMTYLNIHSSTFPGGEIRAQLLPVDIFGDGFEGT